MMPQTRTDLFLAKITGEDVALPVPQTRFELYLANIAGESYELPAPNSRATLYLAKILGQDVELPEPQTRSELYLASIAGMSVQLPEAPTTREEWYLARWAENAAYVVITGDPVSFNAVAAALRQLKIAFSPVQDLNGYANPWPAGGGKNLSHLYDAELGHGSFVKDQTDNAVTVYNTTETVAYKYAWYKALDLTGLGGQTLTFSCKATVISGEDVPRVIGAFFTEDGMIGRNLFEKTGTSAQATVTVPADIPAGAWLQLAFYSSSNRAGAQEIRYYDIQVEKGSSATSYSPYENECPISGWTGVNVEQTNKNLILETLTGYAINTSGKITADASKDVVVAHVKAGHRYAVTIDETNTVFAFYKDLPQAGETSYNGERVVSVGRDFLAPIDGYVALRINSGYATPQIEQGATPTDYTAPSSSLIPVVFPDGETYYSGWVDLITGDGLATGIGVTFNGTEAWSTGQAWRPTLYSLANTIKHNTDNNRKVGLVCDHFKETTPNESYTKKIGLAVENNGYIFCVPTGESVTGAEMKAWFAENPTKVVFPLAEPIPFHVDPQQINSLAGTNTMWSDANGELTAEYWKDGNVSDAEALSMLLGGRYSPAQGPEDVPDREALRIITGR